MTKWRYKILHLSNDKLNDAEFDKYGDMGWELVGVIPPLPDHWDTYTFVFKQPKE